MESLSTEAAAALGAFLATLGIFAIVIAAAWYLLLVIANWKIFTKAGKSGWLSLIPIVNTWNIYDLSWSRTMAWVVIILAVIAGIVSPSGDAEQQSTLASTLFSVLSFAMGVITLIHLYKLAKSFGKGVGFFIGLVLLNPIFMLILGFDSSTYQGRS